MNVAPRKRISPEVLFYDKAEMLKGMPFNVRFFRHEEYTPHYHNFCESVIVLGGSGLHRSSCGDYRIFAGDVFTISPGIVHGYDECSNLFLVNLMLDPEQEWLPEADLRNIPGFAALFDFEPQFRRQTEFRAKLTLNVEKLTHLCAMMQSLNDELRLRPAGYLFTARGYLALILSDLSRCYGASGRTGSYKMTQLTMMLQFMKENHRRRITLEDIARHGNTSTRGANRIFNEFLQMPPIEQLLQIRLHAAAEMLGVQGCPVAETAYACGFNDSNYFSVQFRKLFGLSPRAYAKRGGRIAETLPAVEA